ncbi:hypothetical protein [Dyella caseinilytica]|uniref:Uncharacterized protein n=1 Tax=Dyella caseinilytica TaxID=1849581 RepID=A0ABX7GWC7_9GAMM|nr:hypothetical protein [Dyella caseinilytica]QRN54790.1 hypothetical protein ISN74_05385 [Dyella caseinilytica]GFZ96868.1 hypothetical protein GCM10011408_16640 [Dyella caseinilytica]
MKRTAPHCTRFRLTHVGFVLLACVGIGSLPAHAAGLKPDANAGAHSMFTLEVINDTRSHIDSFSIAPTGTDHWTNIDFRGPMQESSFDDALAVMLQIHDDGSCLHDLRTVLSDGRRIVTRHVDLCHLHAYRPGLSFSKVQE